MAFHFTLATVLRLREIAEQREERLLTRILAQITSTRQSLDELQQEVSTLLRLRERELQTSAPAAKLHITYAQMRSLEVMQREVNEQLAKLEGLRQQQMKVYEAAHRAREVVAGLRENQLQAYLYQQARAEQKLMDDNFIARYLRN
jgi:flagellar export protein FliJ